jgi:hypothetical protein
MKKYKAALARFEGILKKYPDSGLEKKIYPLIDACRKELSREKRDRQSARNRGLGAISLKTEGTVARG